MPPQGRKSAEEILGLAPRRKSAEEILGIVPPAPAPVATQPQQGILDSFATELSGLFLRYGVKPAAALGDALNQALNAGNFEPLKNMAEGAGRSALNIASAFDPTGAAYEPTVASQAPRMAELKQAEEARLPETLRLIEQGYNVESAKPRTTAGKVAGVVGGLIGGAAPAVLTGIATGGSLPAIAATAALQSAAEPENLAFNVGAAVIPLPLGKLVAPILRRIRGIQGVEAAAPEIAAEVRPPSLAKAIGENAFDDTKVAVEDLGLQHVPQPTRPANAYPVPRQIPVEDITLSRDNLSRGRMFQAQEALEQGVKGEGETFTTPGGNQRAVEPIQVVPDPQNPGKFIVEGDGNHRIALLKLQGNNELIPVKSFETEAQSAVVNEATAGLRENYYNPPMEMPQLGEGGFVEPQLTVSYGEPKRYAGAAGPRINEYGFVEGENPGVVTPAERTSVMETISALRKANMLTGPQTHLKNLGGNAGFVLSEEAARVPAAIVDMVVSPITGRRTITGPNLGAIGRSAYEAATKGVQEAWQIIKNGISEADAEALSLKELNSGSKVLDFYVNGVFRLLNAADRIFKTYAFRRALEDRARSIALTEIRAGDIARGQYGDRVRELVNQPPEALAASSIADAEVATFTEPNKLAAGINKFREALPEYGKFGVDLILPFVKTPTNIVKRVIEYSGGGFGKSADIAARSIIKRSMSEAEQRAFAQSFGRASIGSGLIILGAKLYKDGLMTGFTEDDPSRKARDEAAGRVPGSILIGDTWHQIVGFSPIGNLMVIGATIQRESNQERDDALKAYLEAGAQAVGEQPLMMGAQQIASGLKNPGTVASRTLGGMAGSFVPTMAANVAQMTDTQRRQTNTLAGQIENRIPGLRNTLPPKPDVLGQPVPLPPAFDPTKSTAAQEQTNPLFRELVRLDVGISGFQKKKDETEEQHAEKVTTFGQLYGQYGLGLINSQPYQNADDATRKELFDLFNHRVKSVVTENEERFAQAKLSPAIIYQAFSESELRKRQKALQRRTP